MPVETVRPSHMPDKRAWPSLNPPSFPLPASILYVYIYVRVCRYVEWFLQGQRTTSSAISQAPPTCLGLPSIQITSVLHRAWHFSHVFWGLNSVHALARQTLYCLSILSALEFTLKLRFKWAHHHSFSICLYKQPLSYVCFPFPYKHLSNPHFHVGLSFNLFISSEYNWQCSFCTWFSFNMTTVVKDNAPSVWGATLNCSPKA